MPPPCLQFPVLELNINRFGSDRSGLEVPEICFGGVAVLNIAVAPARRPGSLGQPVGLLGSEVFEHG
jgi:hypothetical protein